MAKIKLQMDESFNAIPEVFGVDDKIITKVESSLAREILMNEVLHNGKRVKTAILRDYLDSKEFAELKWDIKTENDYFVLGFAFAAALFKSTEIGDILEKKLGSLIAEMEKDGSGNALKRALQEITNSKGPKFVPQREGIPSDESIDKMFQHVREHLTTPKSSDKDKKVKDEDLPN